MRGLYDHREVSRLTGISESQVRYWDKVGLIPHSRRERGRLLFDFQALVAFRTVRALLDRGVSTRKVRRSVDMLKKSMPEVSEPLSELRITIHGDQIVVGKDQLKFTPDGQIVMDFDGERDLQPIPMPVDDSEELFFQAMDLEDEGKWDKAMRKYTAVLALRPDHVDSLVNLGNLSFLKGQVQAAEHYYRKALYMDPDHVEGNFNLANLFEDQGDLENAVLFYVKAIVEDPEFADAYFNLGRALERKGEWEEAKKQWSVYLDLDGTSEWAEYVRARLREGGE